MVRRWLSCLFLMLMMVACAPAQTAQPSRGTKTDAAVTSYASLVEGLRASGLAIESLGDVEQTWFTPRARVIRIGATGEAQIYEYPTEEQAATEAKRVNPDGSIGTTMPFWIAPPHFFRHRKLLVLYLGSDETSLLKLRAILGNEVAGQK